MFLLCVTGKEWIEDNVNAFCKKMNSIFSAGLDKSALSKTINELGNKIEEWDKGDSRLKRKESLA